MKMKTSRALLFALPLTALLMGTTATPAAADIFAFYRLIPCSLCSLPDTWVFRLPSKTGEDISMFTFTNEGTFIASDAKAPAGASSFHGVWQRSPTDPFRYTMSAVRKTPTGWERIRLLLGHPWCSGLIGKLKFDVLTCADVVGSNPHCDPEGKGWVNQNGPNADSVGETFWDVSADRYQRYPFTVAVQ